MVVMEVSSFFREGIINYFGVSLGGILLRMEVIEILVVLVIEVRKFELENIGDLLDVVPGPSS